MNMKKLLSILLVLTLAVSLLSACAKKEEPMKEETKQEETKTEETKTEETATETETEEEVVMEPVVMNWNIGADPKTIDLHLTVLVTVET